jgi:hypothetical protein
LENKRVLNVGGGANRGLPPEYEGYQQLVLDIDASVRPDFIMDALDMVKMEPNQFDVAYSSHNLEHFYYHHVPVILAGMFHVLKPGGKIDVRVPDIMEIISIVAQSGMDLEDPLYYTPEKYSVAPLDVIYGWSKVIALTGQPYFAHKTGFSCKSLHRALGQAGFIDLEIWNKVNFEIKGIGYKPKQETR